MPLLIDPGEDDAIDLDTLCATLDDTRMDPLCPESLAEAGPWLARLARNRTFLADLALDELERRFAGQSQSGYGAQVLLMRPPDGRWVLRAAFWPAMRDAAVHANGPETFFYGHAHDHNFSFLTVGYLGPGYESDYWEWDGAGRAEPGDVAHLRAMGRQRLDPGKLMLYRAHTDVHAQAAPERFSVSLNILAHDPHQQWRTQYRFAPAEDRIAAALNVAPAEALTALAVHFAGEEGRGLAAEMARRHPLPRMRATALAALVGAGCAEGCDALELAADDPCAAIADRARTRLANAA